VDFLCDWIFNIQVGCGYRFSAGYAVVCDFIFYWLYGGCLLCPGGAVGECDFIGL